jgi:hypothetical protein
VVIAASLASSLMSRFPARVLMGAGFALGSIGMVMFTQIGVHTGYLTHVLPPEIIMSLGLGIVFVTTSNVALVGVADRDAGVASAMVNTTQQVGGSIGTALLNTIAASATGSYLASHRAGSAAAALVHGYTVSFWVGVGFLAAGFVVVTALVNAGRTELPSAEAALVA